LSGAGDNGVPRKARAASVNRLSFALVTGVISHLADL
jgi:hypothetical protein